MISTNRLKVIHKQENQRRKFVCVMNDVAKTQQDLYAGYIDKEKHESAQNCQKNIVSTRKTVVRQRVLRRCMKKQREDVRRSEATTKYGRYHGVSVENISERVEPYIEQHHPRIRRQKKVDKLFKDGYNNGAILDTPTIHSRVQKYFERPLVELYNYSDKPKKSTGPNLSLPPLGKSFYTGSLVQANDLRAEPSLADIIDDDHTEKHDSRDETSEKLFVNRKVKKFLDESIPDDLSVTSDLPTTVTYKTKDIRPLTLPPIKIGTDKPDDVPATSKDCIQDLLDRMSKAKERRERDMKIKKEKRTKRLLADRVQRNQFASFVQHSEPVEFVTQHDLYVQETIGFMNSRPTTRRLEVRKDMVKHAGSCGYRMGESDDSDDSDGNADDDDDDYVVDGDDDEKKEKKKDNIETCDKLGPSGDRNDFRLPPIKLSRRR